MTVPPSNEQDLIERAKHDVEAFRYLYRAYVSRIYAYVAYRVGHAQDAEDITSEIFLKVVESIVRFENRGEGAFAAWLFRIAYNTLAQYYRDNHEPETVLLEHIHHIASESLTPDEALLLEERYVQLSHQIRNLSPRRQEIVTLRFFGGLRNNEIASVLALDERTVAAHLCRAIEDLQHAYFRELNRSDD